MTPRQYYILELALKVLSATTLIETREINNYISDEARSKFNVRFSSTNYLNIDNSGKLAPDWKPRIEEIAELIEEMKRHRLMEIFSKNPNLLDELYSRMKNDIIVK